MMFPFLPVFGDSPADVTFAHLVYLAWPATLIYPLLYAWVARKVWWRSWIGRALMVEAIGVFTLLTFSVLYQMFGPNYVGRDFVRLSGMSISLFGFWMVLGALLKVRWDMRIPGDEPFWLRALIKYARTVRGWGRRLRGRSRGQGSQDTSGTLT